MPRIVFCLVVVVLIPVLGGVPVYAQGATPVGIWLHDNKRIKVEIFHCENKLCGKIVWFKRPNDAEGVPLIDLKNEDPALRSRPLLGLIILRGLVRTGERTWGKGKIYNPDDGEDYRAKMTMPADGTLRVRAYVLLPLFGKTFTWTRIR